MTETPKTVEAMLAHKMHEVLTDWCITRVEDDSKARSVIIGKPTKEMGRPPVISIHTQHPLGPGKDTDRMAMGTPTSVAERPDKWPVETIGGMRTDVIIGTIQINFRKPKSAAESSWAIGAIAARVRNAINQDARLAPFKDEMGNFMSKLVTFQHSGHTGGGANITTHIRWVDWRATVHSTNCRR